MAVRIIRLIFTMACVVMGVTWARFIIGNRIAAGYVMESTLPWLLLGGFIGAVLAAVIFLLLYFVTQEMYERVAPSVVAILIALIAGYSASRYLLFWFPDLDFTYQVFISVTVVLIFGYIGIQLALTRASNWESLVSEVRRRDVRASNAVSLKLVDTSVLIDGRIADICQSGFVEGTLLIPRFVLKELQNIADSADIVRRA
ncbi:MAG TPA: hypothetical protein PLC40_13160, partial [Candidatus Hydrogenedentes bacterium]|nr:hypothetical protein [Candidatus Hydrogenedentota bacterium]